MSKVSLHASWTDGEAFQALWTPLEDADEFILISCYVSQTGWEHLEAILRAHLERPSFRCTLVFSLAGIASSNSRQLVDRLHALASDDRWRGSLVPFVLDDRGARLFHPKAHGSRAGNQFKVVVGSANLTGAGIRSNYELMTLIEGDEAVYNSLQVAVNALARGSVVRVDDESIGPLRDDLAARDLLERSAITRPSVKRDATPPARPLPDRKYDLLVHPSSDYLAESSRVRNLMTQGAQLARLDQLDPLSISVPLTTFRDAKVIAASEAQEIGAGLSYETGGSSIAVSLLPTELRKRLKAITRPLGRLIGRFSIEVLGTRWMPIPWEEELRGHWTQIMREVDFASAKDEVLEHVKLLSKELKSGKLARKLGDQVMVQKPTEWDEELAPRALGWGGDRDMPSKLTAGLKAEVVEIIIDHVASTVGRRLTPDFAALQLAQIGRGPWLRPLTPEAIDLTSGLYFLAELAMAGVAPRLRSATGALSHAPGRSGIVEILARRFDNKMHSAQDVYAEASRWQAEAYDEVEAGVESVKTMFVGASQRFVRWFGLTPEVAAAEWAEHPPTWTVKSAQNSD